MKKERFDTEITILRDTFRRLLRRHAKSNIIKLIGKTHPADMALTFRYFIDEEQDTIFSMMKPSVAFSAPYQCIKTLSMCDLLLGGEP